MVCVGKLFMFIAQPFMYNFNLIEMRPSQGNYYHPKVVGRHNFERKFSIKVAVGLTDDSFKLDEVGIFPNGLLSPSQISM